MIRNLLLIVLTFYVVSCSEQNDEACDYNIYNGLAKVVSIEPYTENNKQLFHVGLQFNTSNLSKEIQYLEKIKSIEIDSSFIAKNSIKKGINYIITVSEIKEGNCSPLFISFDYNFSR